MSGALQPVFHTSPPLTPSIFWVSLPSGSSQAHLLAGGECLPTSPQNQGLTYFDGQIFLSQGHQDLDRRENEAGFMAFHSRSHGILWRERGKDE